MAINTYSHWMIGLSKLSHTKLAFFIVILVSWKRIRKLVFMIRTLHLLKWFFHKMLYLLHFFYNLYFKINIHMRSKILLLYAYLISYHLHRNNRKNLHCWWSLEQFICLAFKDDLFIYLPICIFHFYFDFYHHSFINFWTLFGQLCLNPFSVL